MEEGFNHHLQLSFLKHQKICKLSSGYRMAYIDNGNEGKEAVVMVHGNPTWSFFYRNLIDALHKDFHCIAPDHIGFGFSEKPKDKDAYTLASHIRNLEELIIDKLNLKKFHLVVHDWGGPIGLSLVTKYIDRIKSIVILNTAAFFSKDIPKRIRICRSLGLGKLLVCGCNAFVKGLIRMGTVQPLPVLVKAGYKFPYNKWSNRRGIYKLLREIPTKPSDESYKIIQDLEDKLELLAEKKVLIFWGGKDFCFHDDFYEEWKRRWPLSQTIYLPQAGHLVLEDAEKEDLGIIRKFLVLETNDSLTKTQPYEG